MGDINTDDPGTIRAIHAALAVCIMHFDTTEAYGAGHSERALDRAFKSRADALVVIGIGIDQVSRLLTGDETDPNR